VRKLGIDYGDVRIGFALSDIMGIIASPLEVYARQNLKADLQYISALIEKNAVDAVIIGLPLNMDGSEGERAEHTYEFAEVLKKACNNISVHFVDERLTSAASERMLIAADVRREKRKQIIDKIAAQAILQSYLDNPNKWKTKSEKWKNPDK